MQLQFHVVVQRNL